MRALALAAAVLIVFEAQAQKPFELTVDSIMRGPELVGYEPESPRWSGDGQRIYFDWKQRTDPVLKPDDTYVVNRDGSGLRKLSDDEADLAPPPQTEASRTRQWVAYVRRGDVFVYDFASDKARRITHTDDAETNAGATKDGKLVWFTRANNLYAVSLQDGTIEQLTNIHAATDTSAPADKKGTDSQEFVKKENRELLDIVRQRAAEKEREEARKKADNPRKEYKLEARQTVRSLELAPDGKTVVAVFATENPGAKKTIVPNYVTESAYTEDIPSRLLVGDVVSRTRLALISVADGSIKWVEHGLKDAPPQQRTEQGEKPVQPKDRDVSVGRPVWSEDGTRAVMLARSSDNKERWVLALDPATGTTRVLVSLKDEAWIDGPGSTTLGWMRGDREVYFQSERDGYSHLYTVSFDGGEPRQLTSGKWEVQSARQSRDKSRFILATNEGDPSEVHLYSMPAEGGPRTKLTTMPGHHAGTLSRNDGAIADLYSYTNKPTELYVMENRAGANETRLTTSPAPEFASYPWLDAPVDHFAARDGASIPVRVYKPANFRRGGPAVIFVHGAGYLQNVHRWWSSYYREYMFHHILMARGFMVIDIDYRGSAGYGRDWRTAIYRHMGGKDLDDHVDAAKWLVSQHGVDPKRIGIYGGSYGGFITLMAMFTQPDVFAAGAALRPVTDWSHYNDGYTSNILNTPQKDGEAYKKSSPIYFAEGLKGALLICHGVVDANVHFQDSVRLAQRLIELRKENWELAMFPAEDHGFVQPTSWADEYKRILKLFETNLNKDVGAAGSAPAARSRQGRR